MDYVLLIKKSQCTFQDSTYGLMGMSMYDDLDTDCTTLMTGSHYDNNNNE